MFFWLVLRVCYKNGVRLDEVFCVCMCIWRRGILGPNAMTGVEMVKVGAPEDRERRQFQIWNFGLPMGQQKRRRPEAIGTNGNWRERCRSTSQALVQCAAWNLGHRLKPTLLKGKFKRAGRMLALQGKRRKRNDVATVAKNWWSVPRGTWGTGRIACATERRRQNR
jgi:hypothetical protein